MDTLTPEARLRLAVGHPAARTVWKRPGSALSRLPATPAPTWTGTALVLGQLALLAALLGWLVQWLLPHLPTRWVP